MVGNRKPRLDPLRVLAPARLPLRRSIRDGVVGFLQPFDAVDDVEVRGGRGAVVAGRESVGARGCGGYGG